MQNKPLKFPEQCYPKRSEQLNLLISLIENYKYTETSDTLNDLIQLVKYIEELEETVADLNYHWS